MSNNQIIYELSEIYTLMCRSCLNKEYYGERLERMQLINNLMEIFVAVGAAGSGISALTIWEKQPYGPMIWGSLTIISSFLAISKPIIQINKRIERLSRLYIGHTDNYTFLLILISRIKRRGHIDADMLSLVETIEAKYLDLSKDDDPKPKQKILDKCEANVRMRHPPADAWYPPYRQDQK